MLKLMLSVLVRYYEAHLSYSHNELFHCCFFRKPFFWFLFFSIELLDVFRNLLCRPHNNIQFHFRSDHKFYGLKPKTSAEAMQLVIEHEYVHAIMILIFESEQLGHNEFFMYLAKHLFGHSSMEVK